MKPKKIILLFSLIFVCSPLIAEELIGDRPDFTESALAVPEGIWQLEAGLTLTSLDEADVTEVGEVLLRRGISQTVELRFIMPSFAILRFDDNNREKKSGHTNAAFGVKYELIQGRSATPQVAVLAHVQMPWGSPHVVSLDYALDLVLAAEWDLTESVGLGINLGGDAVFTNETLNNKWLSAALGFGWSDRLGVFVEGFTIIDDAGESFIYADAGLTYLVNPDLQLDLRVGTGSSDEDEETFFGAGVVRRF